MAGVQRALHLMQPNDIANQPNSLIPSFIQIDRPLTVVGRSQKADIRLCLANSQNTISRRHAEFIISADGSCHINDVGSLNGVFVNRVKISTVRLTSGDLVQFGGAAGIADGTKVQPPANTHAIIYRYGETPLRSQQSNGSTQGIPASSSSSSSFTAANDSGAAAGSNAGGNADGSGKRKRGGGGGAAEGGKGGDSDGGKKGKSNGLSTAASTLAEAAGGDAITAEGKVAYMMMMQSGRKASSIPGEEEAYPSSISHSKLIHPSPSSSMMEVIQDLPMLVQEITQVFQILDLPSTCGLQGAAAAIKKLVIEVLEARRAKKVEASRPSSPSIAVRVLQNILKEKDAECLAAQSRAEKYQKDYDKLVNEADARNDAVQSLERELEILRAEKTGLEARMASNEKVQERKDKEAKAEKKRLQDKIKAMEATVADLTRVKHSLQTQLEKTKSIKQAAASSSLSANTQAKGELSLKKLKAELGCALCQGLLMDAGVLPCSHAFCYKCAHQHLNKTKTQRDCPICRESVGQGLRPYRSMHLDTIVTLVTENFQGTDLAEWEAREAATRAFYDRNGGERLVCYGEGKTRDEQEEEKSEAKEKKEIARREKEGGLSRKSFSMEIDEITEEKKRRSGPFNDDEGAISPSQKQVEQRVNEHICESCCEKGHYANECPHASHLPDEEEEEEEEDDDE